ncbi:DUF3592 domain-containing protein [Streptomyces shenzhenensis]|uniref:DUF3592 domain-containing protein n=1 Tax=Streptomyces shenzhenensis TaxID=943815 RepID=UPI0015F0C84E|nr:DUF3592 domain-containing protein [Streptomyces shenzhenensis]
MTRIQDEIRTRGYSRSELRADAVRGAARVVMRTATLVVVVALGVAATAGWGTPLALGGWTVAAVTGAVGLIAGLLRTLIGDELAPGQGGDLFAALISALLLWSFAATLAFCLSNFFHAHALDRRATLKVTATVSHCVNRGDGGSQCTYRWVAGDHTYSSQDNAERVWPDGHRVTVRIDPAHPDRPAQVTRNYWALWVGVAVGALGSLVAALMTWRAESDLDE